MRNIRIAPVEARISAPPASRHRRESSRLTNVLATIPILLLGPALLIPVFNAAATSPTYASDTFQRTVSSGWGSANIGGSYTLSGSPSAFAVGGAGGTMKLVRAGVALEASLRATTARDVDVTFTAAASKTATGTGEYVYGVGRQVAIGTEYRAKMRLASSGSVYLQANRVLSGTETSLGSEVSVAALARTAGVPIHVRFQIVGANPTMLSMKAWTSSTEPTAWAYSVSDGSPALQTAGALGLRAYLSQTSTNAPVTVTFGNFLARGLDTPSVTPSATPTPTPTPTATPAPSPAATSSATPTLTPTSAPAATSTPTATPTSAPTSTPTATPTPTPLPTPTPVLATNAFYVATWGNDANSGTSTAPWLTLQKAVNSVPAGATVYVRAGTYGGFKMTRSGSSSAPIVISGYPGDARPVIAGNGTQIDTVYLSGSHDVTISGFVVQGSAGVGDQGAGIRTDASAYNIRITNNLIRNNNAYGINSYKSSYVAIDGNEITGNETGVQIAYAGEGTTITNNRVHDNNRMVVNTTSPTNDDHGAVGITFVRSTGHVVASGNTLWGNRAPSYDYGYDGGAFEIYAASNVWITNNTMWNNENVLETGTDSSTPCDSNVFARNVAYGGTTAGESTGMYLRCASNGTVASNTFYNLDQFVFALSSFQGTFGGSIDGLRVVDNVAVMASGKIYGIDTALPSTVVVDHNDAWNSSGGYVASVTGKGSTTSFSTFRSWTGYEVHGFNANPSFASASTQDFHLNSGSVAIDRGIVVSGISDSYVGIAPDMGRYEYGQ